MKILYIPLDERPCNYDFPVMYAQVCKDMELIVPPVKLMGKKKMSADIDGLWEFVENQYGECDGAVLSLDMLIYGGLLPSRLHHLSIEWQDECGERLRKLRTKYPEVELFAFSLIMRTPRYSSSDEEPDYYGIYGKDIFRRAFLKDKIARTGDTAEKPEYDELCRRIPEEYLLDYEKRREYNLKMNYRVLELVRDGIINFLSIPLDDSCEYGYTACDQKRVWGKIEKYRLWSKVFLYPGADETGAALVARMYSSLTGEKKKIWSFYSSLKAPFIVPLYEDRIMGESLKAHILAAGAQIAAAPEEADFILAVNSPGEIMQESFEWEERDATYMSCRNLNWFVNEISQFQDQGKKVAIADCAFSNGGDIELIKLLDEYGALDKSSGYHGWNTCCNTLGSAIAQGILASGNNICRDILERNILYHILDDGFYQARVRKMVSDTIVKDRGKTVFDIRDIRAELAAAEEKLLKEMAAAELRKSFQRVDFDIKITHPWNRMFEIGMELDYKKRDAGKCG